MSPQADPHIASLGGLDVTALSVKEMEQQGIRIKPGREVPEGGVIWRSHSEYAGLDPRRDAIERSYARVLAHKHVEMQRREVPCPTCRADVGKPCRGMTINSYAASCHEGRRAAASKSGITLRGLTLPRTFPCLGSFRHVELVAGSVMLVACDRCGSELAVKMGADDGEHDPPDEPDQEPFGAFT